MLEKLAEIFSGKACVKAGYDLWNALTGAAVELIGQAPSELAGGALWKISTALLISMKLIGASLFTLLFLINFCKKTANLREDRPFELQVELFFKLILGNYLLVNVDTILSGLVELMQAMLGVVAPDGMASLILTPVPVDDWDNDSLVIGLIFGVVFMGVCLAGGLMLILHVYSVFFKMYYYMVISPLALATVGGPEGAARSAENWLKTFLCCLLEFVGMILMLRLCAALINANGFFIAAPPGWEATESLWNMIQSMLVILLTVGSVKTVDNLTRRALGF